MHAFAANPAATAPTPNVWIWSLAHVELLASRRTPPGTSCSGRRRTEHDLFGARKMDFVNPVRASVWKDEEFRDRIDKSYPGYLEQYEASAPGAKIYFTAAAAVLRPDHRVGGDAAEDGGQGSPGRRGPRQAGRQHRQAAEGGRPRLSARSPARPSSRPGAPAQPRRRSERGWRAHGAMTAARATMHARRTASRFRRQALPYLLSLPALLVCIGILMPFFTAVYYSLQRFRLNLPMLQGLHLVRATTSTSSPTRRSGTRSRSRCSMRC